MTVSALILTVGALTSCGGKGGKKSGVSEETYATLNRLVEATDGYRMTSTTTVEGESLRGAYDIVRFVDGYSVKYEYETLHKIDIENPTGEYKSVCKGSAIVRGGEVIASIGDGLQTIPEILSVEFQAAYFADAEDDEGKFRASVIDFGGFLGTAKPTQNATVEIEYADTAVREMTLNYQTSNAEISIVYDFTVVLEKEVTLSAERLTLEKDAMSSLVVSVGGEEHAAVWTSSDNEVVTVDGEGLLCAVGVGAATITATVGDRAASCLVTVEETKIPLVSVRFVVDGKTIDEFETETREKIVPSTPPSYVSYTFDGWFAEGATAAFDFSFPIEEDTTFTANYSIAAATDHGGVCTISTEEILEDVDATTAALNAGEYLVFSLTFGENLTDDNGLFVNIAGRSYIVQKCGLNFIQLKQPWYSDAQIDERIVKYCLENQFEVYDESGTLVNSFIKAGRGDTMYSVEGQRQTLVAGKTYTVVLRLAGLSSADMPIKVASNGDVKAEVKSHGFMTREEVASFVSTE